MVKRAFSLSLSSEKEKIISILFLYFINCYYITGAATGIAAVSALVVVVVELCYYCNNCLNAKLYIILSIPVLCSNVWLSIFLVVCFCFFFISCLVSLDCIFCLWNCLLYFWWIVAVLLLLSGSLYGFVIGLQLYSLQGFIYLQM